MAYVLVHNPTGKVVARKSLGRAMRLSENLGDAQLFANEISASSAVTRLYESKHRDLPIFELHRVQIALVEKIKTYGDS